MKRSKTLSLLLMGSLTLGGSVGCSKTGQDQFSAYSTVTECIQDGQFTDQECQEFAEQAKSQAVAFASQEECEAQFGAGACEKDAGDKGATSAGASQSGEGSSYQHTSSWAPIFWGFMAGRFLSGGSAMQGATPLYRGASGTGAAGTGGLRTSWGEPVSPDAKGRVKPTSSLRQNMNHVAKPRLERQSSGKKTSSSGFNKSGGAGSGGS